MKKTQFGFGGGIGTKEALFAMAVLAAREHTKVIYASYLSKKFGQVSDTKSIEELQSPI